MGGYCTKLDKLTEKYSERCRITQPRNAAGVVVHEGGCHPRNAKNPIEGDPGHALELLREQAKEIRSLQAELRKAGEELATSRAERAKREK